MPPNGGNGQNHSSRSSRSSSALPLFILILFGPLEHCVQHETKTNEKEDNHPAGAGIFCFIQKITNQAKYPNNQTKFDTHTHPSHRTAIVIRTGKSFFSVIHYTDFPKSPN